MSEWNRVVCNGRVVWSQLRQLYNILYYIIFWSKMIIKRKVHSYLTGWTPVFSYVWPDISFLTTNLFWVFSVPTTISAQVTSGGRMLSTVQSTLSQIYIQLQINKIWWFFTQNQSWKWTHQLTLVVCHWQDQRWCETMNPTDCWQLKQNFAPSRIVKLVMHGYPWPWHWVHLQYKRQAVI